MRKYLAIAMLVTLTAVTDVFAQGGGGGLGGGGNFIVTYNDFSFTLRNIISSEVITHHPNGVKLAAPRHRVSGSYIPNPPACPVGQQCPQVMPVPFSVSVVFRGWEYGKNQTQAHMLNVCLRSIDSSKIDASVILRGNVTFDIKNSVMFMHSLSSCFVGTGARIN